MKFNEVKLPTGLAFIADRYKCVQYGASWFAFFKPKDWKNWGDSCEKGRSGSARYKTLLEAKGACARHRAKFGKNPSANNSLPTY